jgi:hypothetical protein
MSKVRFFFILVLVTAVFLGARPQAALADHGSELEFETHLRGKNENPARVTNAKGEFEAELSEDGMSLYYRLELKNISNATASHIHLGSAEVNGPVVAFLYGSVPPGSGFSKEIVVEGVITGANLVGPLAGQPLSALIAQMEAGNTYVNAHTNDGIDPTNTGPGDFPGGEVRGQISVEE